MKESRKPKATGDLQDAIAELKEMVESGFQQIHNKLREMEERQDALESHLEARLPGVGKRLTPALEETLTALEELAGIASWVDVPPLAAETQKAVSTVEADLRRLLDLGLISRKTDRFTSKSGRRLRRYVYRPR